MGWKKGEAKERVGKGRGKEGRREESSETIACRKAAVAV